MKVSLGNFIALNEYLKREEKLKKKKDRSKYVSQEVKEQQTAAAAYSRIREVEYICKVESIKGKNGSLKRLLKMTKRCINNNQREQKEGTNYQYSK